MYDEERPYTVISENCPEKRAATWEMAEGLQAVDGLEVSSFAHEVGKRYISGEYSAPEAKSAIETRYSGRPIDRGAEADIVASRINELVAAADRTSFKCRPHTLLQIHAALFDGALENQDWVGRWRKTDIEKSEPVLGGRSVPYSPAMLIESELEYDFQKEDGYIYRPGLQKDGVGHLAEFIAGIWQIHPFREGNTRTVATFSQLYLGSLGVPVDNMLFKEKSTWFRDALVRAGFSSVELGINGEPMFIRAFFEKLVLGADHDLDSMDMNIEGER